MAIANKTPVEGRSSNKARPDSPAARLIRFAVGSIFGIIFIVLCFIMLSVALKGPDTIKVDGVTGEAGLIGAAPKERLKVGDPAPDFLLAQLGGDPVQLSKLRGKTVFVNFWATWCDPCREEMPAMQRIYQKYKNDNVVVLAVNQREGDDGVKSYFKTNSLTMPVLLDKTGDVAGGFRVTGFPESYFIDKNGKIGAFHINAMTFDEMEGKLQETWKLAGK